MGVPDAVLRVTPDQVDFFLHPQFDPNEKAAALSAENLLASGLNVSPGSASGVVAFDADLADLKIRLQHVDALEKVDALLAQIAEKEQVLKRVESMHANNPILGMRGVRLGIQIPELTLMQVRAIFEAACIVSKEGIDVHPEVMIPLTCHANGLKAQEALLEEESKNVMREQGLTIDYKFGTMIEIPRAALTAGELAEFATFFSFGTNDLTQTAFGISRDDAEFGFLMRYINSSILPNNPFATIDKTVSAS